MTTSEVDFIFPPPAPLLLAHRGGAGEAPESTEAAFRSAIHAGADGLEIDLQMTSDREIVVWHGPGLRNVRKKSGEKYRKRIWDHEWVGDLQDNAYVDIPRSARNRTFPPNQRLLLSFERFLTLVSELEDEYVRAVHLNLELKKTEPPAPSWIDGPTKPSAKLEDFAQLLANNLGHRRRVMLVTSRYSSILDAFHVLNRKISLGLPTGVTQEEQHAYLASGSILARIIRRLIPHPRPRPNTLEKRAFQTYWGFLAPKLVSVVGLDKGVVHCFLTRAWQFAVLAKDNESEPRVRRIVCKSLNFGVKGFITDYPTRLLRILRQCGERRPGPGPGAISLKNGAEFRVYARLLLNETGFRIKEGKTYEFDADAEWVDGPILTDANGFSRWYLAPWWFLRRVPSAKWFALMGQIGENGEPFVIGKNSSLTAEASGELLMFANDVRFHYSNNCGFLEVTVREK
ncbi:MAG: glycerophosphodiester phosphodiesterase family protein [Planctomycetota bacterium]|nr:glycerophosphodiester phosphodiesterase family protein [Planctomycetota bacterium]